MTNNIDKKKYEKPSMKVYQLQSQSKLLAGSGEPPLGGPWPGGESHHSAAPGLAANRGNIVT